MLFRCAIQLSISSEHWAEIAYEPADPGSMTAISQGKVHCTDRRFRSLGNILLYSGVDVKRWFTKRGTVVPDCYQSQMK